MQSMTGFGRGSSAFGGGRLVLELKSVNHRFLEVRSRSQRELLTGEALVERLLRGRLNRGYLTVNLWYEAQGGGTTTIDTGTLKTHLLSLQPVARELNLDLSSLVGILSGAPDLYAIPTVENEDELKDAVEKAFGEAIEKLLSMREAEGQAMADELERQTETLDRYITELERRAQKWPQIALERLRKRLDSFINGTEIQLDQDRLATEVALLADKADVSEEITRLSSHLSQMKHITKLNQPIGRRLEFLIQEMGRETNTVGAKTALPEVSTVVIDIKTELEKMRELAQNIE